MFLNKKITFVFYLISGLVFSQENQSKRIDTTKVNELEEVVITATRTKRQLSSVPMPVRLISKKQLRQSGSVRLRDILLEQTGIVMVADVANSEGVQMQGVAADYTLIMIDGVPIVGRVAGNIDLRRLTVNNIKQIEIVKGPSSSLYGSEAMGGVINIITEQPKKNRSKGSLQILTRSGARNEFDFNANIITKKEKLGIVAGINANSSSGYDLTPESPNTKTVYPHQNYTGNLQLTYDFSENLKTIISSRVYTQEQNTPTSDNTQTDWNVNGKISHRVTKKWSLDYTFYGTRFKTKSVFEAEASLFNRSLFRPEIRTKIDFDSSNLIFGVGANFDALNRSFFENTEKYRAQFILAQYDFNPIKDLNVVVGARFDNHNEYKSAFSPKISAGYKINDWLSTKASVGFGFKAPDFRQLYFNFRNSAGGYAVFGTQAIHDLFKGQVGLNHIEKELNPETSIGYNFGFQLKPTNKLKVNINFFRNNISNLIDTFDVNAYLKDEAKVQTLNPTLIGLNSNTRIFSYRNINKVYTQGVEVEATYRINDNFKLLGGYQFLDTGDKDQERKIKNGEIFFRRTTTSPTELLTIDNYFGLLNRSKHTANIKLFYENFEHDFSANLRGVFRSKYAVFDTNNSQGIIDVYDNFVSENLQLNFSMEKTFLELMNVQVGIDNLLNEKGEENKNVFFSTTASGIRIPNDNVLRLGRTFYGRITFNIN